MKFEDTFVFVEENSNSNDVVEETRLDIVDRINDIVKDLMQDDKSYEDFLIKDIFNNAKIIEGINEFIGTFVEIK
jgi:translation initiation factor 2 beta subunit (eIF-2beta)/eIF-5